MSFVTFLSGSKQDIVADFPLMIPGMEQSRSPGRLNPWSSNRNVVIFLNSCQTGPRCDKNLPGYFFLGFQLREIQGESEMEEEKKMKKKKKKMHTVRLGKLATQVIKRSGLLERIPHLDAGSVLVAAGIVTVVENIRVVVVVVVLVVAVDHGIGYVSKL